MVAENFRFRKVFARIKSIINDRLIGETYSVICNAFEYMHTERLYGNTKWRQDNKHIGGFVTDGGVHYIAALRDIFGNLSNIGSFTHRVNPSIGTVDTFSFQFVTPDRVKGILNMYFTSKGFAENRLAVFGTKGTIVFENNTLTVKNNEGTLLTETFENDDGYKAEFEAFYECVRSGKPVKSSFFEAYADMKTIIDAISSSVM
jgi:predicted dehydrogenase